MRLHVRSLLMAGFGVLLLALAASPARASFGVSEPNFEAGTCNDKGCTYASIQSTPGEAFTQAAGHPAWGITSFELNHDGSGVPEGQLKRIRVDVPPGLAANPQALPTCTKAQFDSDPKLCPLQSVVGETEMNAVTELVPGVPIALSGMTGTVYNLALEPGLPLQFGIAVEPLAPLVAPVHLVLKGHVSDAFEPSLAARGIPSGDYHEWFEIDEVPTKGEVSGGLKAPLKVLKSKLLFNGNAGVGNFLTLPSECSSSTTSYLEVESYEGGRTSTPTHTPVGVSGCGAVPFAPSLAVHPETTQSDAPDGSTAVLTVKQNENPGEINTAAIEDAHVTLPEGMTLNPAAAPGLAVCSAAQIGIGSSAPVSCPAASQIATVAVETDLPPGSLTGKAYLGSPGGGTITEPPFTIYVDLESIYGVSVRLQGQASPNPATGRLEVSFLHNPQLPFSELRLTATGGARAPLANPLACGTSRTESLFTPYTGLAAWSDSTPFTTDADGHGGACPSPLPFAPAQAAPSSPPTAGAFTSYTFNLERPQGQQYLGKLTTTLPPGLVGLIPSVTLCGEPAAAAGSCTAASQIGTATVAAGSGSAPVGFSGPVYLTGAYGGSPYGLSIPIEAAAGPFDLGRVVTRAAVNVDPYTARVIVSSTLPTIVRGVPVRLRSLSVVTNRPNFLLSPTNCSPLHTDTSLLSTFGASALASSPFQVAGCGALAFKPAFAASSDKRTASRAAGVSLKVSLRQPAHQANIRSVVAQLPLQLPSRLTTLQKACLAATFEANPRSCPVASLVGGATVTTPVLPTPLSGPAYLVSHGGGAFPDLDLVLEGSGVRVILVGNTDIKKGITTSTFASIPDVPASSFSLTLPTGPHSALSAFGNLCAKALLMPTTITAQNGAQVKQNTRISVLGCGVRIVRRRRAGRFLLLTIQTYAPGRVVASGKGVRKVSRRLPKPRTVTLKLPLTRAARGALRRRHHHVRLSVSVLFLPRHRGEPRVRASTALLLKR